MPEDEGRGIDEKLSFLSEPIEISVVHWRPNDFAILRRQLCSSRAI
jgi:hypothetical protein